MASGGRRRPEQVLSPMGIPQIVLGALAMIFNIILMAHVVPKDNYSMTQYWGPMIAYGFWCGIFFIIAGIVSILAARKKSAGLVKLYLILSIVNIITSLCCALFGAITLIQGFCKCYYDPNAYPIGHNRIGRWYCHPDVQEADPLVTGFGVMMLLVGVVELGIACVCVTLFCFGKIRDEEEGVPVGGRNKEMEDMRWPGGTPHHIDT